MTENDNSPAARMTEGNWDKEGNYGIHCPTESVTC